VAARLIFKNDREADDVIARLSPSQGEIENLEVLFLSTGILRTDFIELTVQASLRLPGAQR